MLSAHGWHEGTSPKASPERPRRPAAGAMAGGPPEEEGRGPAAADADDAGEPGPGPLGAAKRALAGLAGRLREAAAAAEGLEPVLAGFLAGAAISLALVVAMKELGPRGPGGTRRRKAPPQRTRQVLVKNGETLGDILVRYVGDYTEDNLNKVLALNAHVQPDLIQVGDLITVPDTRPEVPEGPAGPWRSRGAAADGEDPLAAFREEADDAELAAKEANVEGAGLLGRGGAAAPLKRVEDGRPPPPGNTKWRDGKPKKEKKEVTLLQDKW